MYASRVKERSSQPPGFAQSAREVRAALSLNRTQLALVLAVACPTLDVWLDGQAAPSPAAAERLEGILQLLTRNQMTGSAPLNARFVRRSAEPDEASLLDALCADTLDEERIGTLLRRARTRTRQDATAREARERDLRAKGYEQLSLEERRERLALNIALLPWPRH